MSSLTIVVPALNEESEIANTVRALIPVAQQWVKNFEMILIDDGSRDRTGTLMDSLAGEFAGIRVIHNSAPMGLGHAMAKGLSLARCEYIMLCPGDNAYSTDLLPAVFRRIGESDVILTYRINQRHSRKFSRFIISSAFNFLMTTLFRISAKDIHGMNIYKVELAKQADPILNIGFQLDLVVTLLKAGVKVIEMPITLNTNEYRNKSTSLKPRKFLEIFLALKKIFTRSNRVKGMVSRRVKTGNDQ